MKIKNKIMNEKPNLSEKYIKFFTYLIIILLIITIIPSIPNIILIISNPMKYINIIIGSILLLSPSIIMTYFLLKVKDKMYKS